MKVWKVPLADVTLGPEEVAAVTEVLQSGWLSMGPKTQEFEERFAQFLGVKYAFAVANGTAALHLACEVIGLGPGDEVLCPALTFVASANAILYTGAKPVFVDVAGRVVTQHWIWLLLVVGTGLAIWLIVRQRRPAEVSEEDTSATV